MNCKPGDLAIIKSTHPVVALHGLLVTVDEFIGPMLHEVDVWSFTFAGSPQVDDLGRLGIGGFIQDRFLRPLPPLSEDEHDQAEAGKPEQVAA